MAPRVLRAPEGPAAREARRPHCVRRRASKPARALRTPRRPSHQWGLVCWRVVQHGRSRSPAWTCRRPRVPLPGPPVPPAPFTPVGPGVLARASRIGSIRCPESQLRLPTSNSARNSSMTHSNFEFASLELQRFWSVLKNDRDKLRAKCGGGVVSARGRCSLAFRRHCGWAAYVCLPDR